MGALMGIDVGTSSLKVIAMDEGGKILAAASRDYQFDAPVNGWAEQWGETWAEACFACVEQVTARCPDIAGVSFSGQMHGVVFLDENRREIRPAILHCDARSGRQVEEIRERLGEEAVRRLVRNPIYSGFMLPSLLWVRENEPENFRRIRYVMLPKDYVKFRLSGEITSDYSDASATLLFDMEAVCWSRELLAAFDLPEEIFPPCGATDQVVGAVTAEAAGRTGLKAGTPVVNGGADQVMQALGNGVFRPGQATANIGTSGQVCFQCDRPVVNPALNTNTFVGYEKGRWYTMGATMSAGLSYKWLTRTLEVKDLQAMDEAVAKVPPGSGGLLFLPYLTGERTPHLNTDLTGMFWGLQVNTGRAELCRAVMEGVAYSLMQCMEICRSFGLEAEEMVASGGGARGKPWLQLQADLYNVPLKVACSKEQACVGAAIAAGSGVGVYESIEAGCRQVVRYQDAVYVPNEENHRVYMEYYSLYKEAFAAARPVIEKVTRLGRRQ